MPPPAVSAVTGTGAVGSGGTIQNMTDSGILGSTTANISLSYMNILNNGNALNEGGIRMTGLTGTNSLTSSTVSGGYEDNIFVQNTSGALNLTIQGPNCSITNNSASVGNTGITVLSAGSANMTVAVNNCQFSGNRTDTIHVDAGDSATLNTTISNNTITAGAPNQGNIGIDVTSAGSAVVTYAVTNNKVGTNGVTSAPLRQHRHQRLRRRLDHQYVRFGHRQHCGQCRCGSERIRDQGILQSGPRPRGAPP